MPKIEAVAVGNKLFNVNDVGFTTAYQCPKTKRIFSDRKMFIQHLRRIRLDNHYRILRDQKLAELHDCSGFPEVINWIANNGEFFMGMVRRSHRASEMKEYPSDFKLEITYLAVDFRTVVSNSHSCPKGGVTNFCGDKNLPCGYPGWYGRIEYRTSHHIPLWGSDLMKPLCINTGTGGGISNNRYGFEVKFFESDWPGFTKARLFDMIKNPRSGKESFLYGTPAYFR